MSNLKISPSPHAQSELTTPGVMWGTVAALVPVVIASIFFFRILAVKLIVVCVISCVATEFIIRSLRKKKASIYDGSAVVTGVLLAAILPPALPMWIAVVGSVVAIGLAKELFGGLGYNIFNPALIGRAFLMAAFPTALTTWSNPITLDATTKATPMALMKFEQIAAGTMDLFLGNVAGSLGETSALAIIIGAGYLFIKKYADWRIPLSYILTVAVFGGILNITNPGIYPSILFHMIAGGLLLGVFFMATDPITSPVTKLGRWVFGIGCGVFTVLIRVASGLPEGVMYAILLMNGLTPIINRLTRPRRFGLRPYKPEARRAT